MTVRAKELKKFSLVVPAYNEEKRLPRAILDIHAFFSKYSKDLEVLIVIEKSTDRTLELAREMTKDKDYFRVIDNQVQRGKGYAVKSGMLQAQGELVFFMDADLSTPLVEVLNFLSHFAEEPSVDIIIGSRAHNQSEILKSQNPIRKNMGRTFNKIVQSFAVKGIEDTQCGFKAFRRKTVHPIFSRQSLDGFAFDVEILLIAIELGFTIDTRPIKWVNDPDSKVHIVRDSMKMLYDIIRIKPIVRKTLKDKPFSEAELEVDHQRASG